MAIYRAFIDMEFEPDENGYLEWENFDPEYDTPRNQEQMKRFLADEFYEYLSDYRNKFYDSITVEEVKE